MIPLMPSPGRPKTVSTPQSIMFSTRISAAVSAITIPQPNFRRTCTRRSVIDQAKYVLLEFRGMLFDDAVTQHICHMENLLVDLIVRGNVCCPITLETRYRFSRG